MTATCFAPAANALQRLIKLYGHDPKPYFMAQDITLKMTRDPNVRIRTGKLLAVWQSFSEQVDDPCFGPHFPEGGVDTQGRVHWNRTEVLDGQGGHHDTQMLLFPVRQIQTILE